MIKKYTFNEPQFFKEEADLVVKLSSSCPGEFVTLYGVSGIVIGVSLEDAHVLWSIEPKITFADGITIAPVNAKLRKLRFTWSST